MKEFLKKLKRGLYKGFVVFMVAISMSANPALQYELKKMLQYLNEVRVEQMIEADEDEEEEEQEENEM